ncbi:MAG: polysaccharide lyase family protein [Phycisphaerae bacterium]|nr:polysaccharide lyase family protein [Phycisphaerae bacterium]
MSAFSSLLAAGITLALAAAASEPTNSPAPVTLVETEPAVELANGLLALVIERSTGRVTSLRRTDGPDVFGAKGRNISFDANGRGPTPSTRQAGYRGTGPRDYRLVRRSDDLVDVAFSSPGDDVFPFETELHYVLRAGDSGVYAYVICRRGTDSAPGSLIQTRIVLRLRDALFTHYFVNDQMAGEFPKLSDPSAKVTPVTDATVMFPGGRIATKYNLADFEENHHVHGVAGPQVGLWMISASNEYLNGGPTKQDLHVHEDAVIVLKMLHSGHFRLGAGLEFAQGEAWTKFYGPFFIYLNRAETPAAAWADAKAISRREQAAWPYSWVDHPDYPLIRSQVTGRVTMQGQAPAADACVILAAPDQDWQSQGKGYLFWARTAQDGRFTLSHVRPGTYTLYAFLPGHAGEPRRDGVTAEAERMTDLGAIDFQPLSFGRQLWQIGTPDRTAAEFRHGDQPRQFGLWNRYLTDFPHDLTYQIGTSHERTDWNYCQPVVQRADGSWHRPTWRVVFDLDAAQSGKAHLLIGLAGAARDPELVVSVNDTEVGRQKFPNDGCVYREANQAGHYRLWTIEFDPALLRQGRNVLALELVKSDPPSPQPYNPLSLPRSAILYDFLRLEVSP